MNWQKAQNEWKSFVKYVGNSACKLDRKVLLYFWTEKEKGAWEPTWCLKTSRASTSMTWSSARPSRSSASAERPGRNHAEMRGFFAFVGQFCTVDDKMRMKSAVKADFFLPFAKWYDILFWLMQKASPMVWSQVGDAKKFWRKAGETHYAGRKMATPIQALPRRNFETGPQCRNGKRYA